jgi:glutathione S-transferase
MRLFYSTTSPFVRKVMVAAHETGLASRIQPVQLRPSPLRPDPELSRANPLSKIPALVLDDGTALIDSCVIVEYLDRLHDGKKLIPPEGAQRFRALRRQALADGIIESGVLVFYERTVRPELLRWEEWVSGQLTKVRQGLDALDAEAESFGSDFDIGQIAAAVAIEWLVFRAVDDPLTGRKRLSSWYARVSERPSLQATVPRA